VRGKAPYIDVPADTVSIKLRYHTVVRIGFSQIVDGLISGRFGSRHVPDLGNPQAWDG
jgi:hypothetical protein